MSGWINVNNRAGQRERVTEGQFLSHRQVKAPPSVAVIQQSCSAWPHITFS